MTSLKELEREYNIGENTLNEMVTRNNLYIPDTSRAKNFADSGVIQTTLNKLINEIRKYNGIKPKNEEPMIRERYAIIITKDGEKIIETDNVECIEMFIGFLRKTDVYDKGTIIELVKSVYKKVYNVAFNREEWQYVKSEVVDVLTSDANLPFTE